MQTLLRDSPDKMTPKDYQTFADAHTGGSLISPDASGYLISSLILTAKKELHGKFVSYTAPELQEYQKK